MRHGESEPDSISSIVSLAQYRWRKSRLPNSVMCRSFLFAAQGAMTVTENPTRMRSTRTLLDCNAACSLPVDVQDVPRCRQSSSSRILSQPCSSHGHSTGSSYHQEARPSASRMIACKTSYKILSPRPAVLKTEMAFDRVLLLVACRRHE